MMVKGKTASKRGWPDFVVRDESGAIIAFVEVKTHRGRSLKKEQIEVLQYLSKLGANCYRWSPVDGFEKI